MRVDRFVYVYLIYGRRKVYLVDSGVKSSESLIAAYLRSTGKSMDDISMLILTHSHPDHIGAARTIQQLSGCAIAAHAAEKNWIEDTGLQCRERPVPGFQQLVEGPVTISRLLSDGDVIDLEPEIRLTVLHTPGHSCGSISLLHHQDRALMCGDAVPVPRSMPIYDDVAASVRSIQRLKRLQDLSVMLSSWDDPRPALQIMKVLDDGLQFLSDVHRAVLRMADRRVSLEPAAWAGEVLSGLGIPGAAVNPLVLRSLAAHLEAGIPEVLE